MSGIIGYAGSKSGVIGDHNLKQYDITVSGTAWSTTTAVAIPYQTSNGYWWVTANIVGALSSYGSNNVFGVTVSGFTFIANSAVTAHHQDGQTVNINGQCYTDAGSTIVVVWNGSMNPDSIWGFSFDVRVASKPTWAD